MASHFYIQHASIELFNDETEGFLEYMSEADLLCMIAKSNEFDNMKVRDDEQDELEFHARNSCWIQPVKGGPSNSYGKVNILLQTFVSGGVVNCFSLVSDMAYVAQNSARILRGLFEVAIRRNWAWMSYKLLTLCKTVDKRLWSFQSPLRQVCPLC